MAGLAGCADPDVAMFVDRVSTDRAIGERATIRPDADSEAAAIVANATDNGTEATQDGPAERAPFEPDRPVVSNGTVYDLQWESTGRFETRTEYVVSLTVHEDDRETDIEFADLPEIDRDRLGRFRRRVERYADEDAAEESPPRATFQHRYSDAEAAASALVPEPEYDTIAIAGYPVGVDVRSTTVEADIYRYTATERAPTLAAFGSDLRDRHRVALTGLSEAEREFFEHVIDDNGSYYQGSLDADYEDAFAAFADRLVDEPALFVEDREGEWLVGYEGRDYWVTVDFVRMEEYANQLERVDSL
jgi:hypothetical protein